MAEATSAAEPYSFEPPASLLESSEDEESGSSDGSSTVDEADDDIPAAGDDERAWCQCGHCVVWPGQRRREKVCCHHYPEVTGKFEGGGMQCITTHQGFRDNCLSSYTIESVIVLFKQSLRKRWKEEFENKDEPHRTYRHVAYSNFVRWVWHTTGRKNRKILPACVVATVRNQFPSQIYTGFKYAV
ncbi:uncharacterized protein [Littorina saxatilis]|uniref:uncharacterized protein n=1 Tax=Littorina saxatilis TaxID=31220 RepID=UPI0038B6A3D7